MTCSVDVVSRRVQSGRTHTDPISTQGKIYGILRLRHLDSVAILLKGLPGYANGFKHGDEDR